MPMVQITMLAGRTADQKRKIAKRITEVLIQEAGARREGVVIAFHEVAKESYASGGELMSDKAPSSNYSRTSVKTSCRTLSAVSTKTCWQECPRHNDPRPTAATD